MTTTAQKALEDFEKTWLTVNWTGMNATAKNTHIANHYALKIAAAKEVEANRVESENQAVIDNAARKQQAITYLTNHGFACDNSLVDWEKLYNHPKVFGANWAAQAQYQFSLGNDLDYFLQTAYSFWVEYVKNN
jgi:inosine/xanthosine triphosphate pyrophosphatase family protein